jgi:hypothetical protein
MSTCLRRIVRSLASFVALSAVATPTLAQAPARAPVTPPVPEFHAIAPSPRLPDPALPAAVVKALVLPSWDSGNALAWHTLNTQWPQFGSTQVVIDHGTLGGASDFTYAQLEASGADVLVLSNPAGGNVQYSPQMVEAVARYARAGHHLIGTYRVFQWGSIYNNGLAPLFGAQDTLRYWSSVNGISNQFNILQPSSPLLQGIGPGGWTSLGYAATQLPQAGMPWGIAGLAGAVPIAECDGMKAIVSVYEGQGYTGIYVSSMPDYNVGVDDLQLLYNALTYAAP